MYRNMALARWVGSHAIRVVRGHPPLDTVTLKACVSAHRNHSKESKEAYLVIPVGINIEQTRSWSHMLSDIGAKDLMFGGWQLQRL